MARAVVAALVLALPPGGPAYAHDFDGPACQAAVISDWTGMLQGDPTFRTAAVVAGPWAAPGARVGVECWVQTVRPDLAEPDRNWAGACRLEGDHVVAGPCFTWFNAHGDEPAWLCTRAVATWPNGTVATAAIDADGDPANGVQCPSLFWF